MTDTRDIRSLVDAAEQAAAAGDYVSAEQLLTQVAVLQGGSLGPLHPDLANTLNNLGVVCEILEKPLRAERHFRRAWEIATATLAPDHPVVATSRKNLEDFCNTRGIPVDAPPAEPAVSPEIETTAPLQAMPREPEPLVPSPSPVPDLPIGAPPYGEPRPSPSLRWSWPVAIAALIVGALVVTLIATAPWRGEPAAPEAVDRAPSPPTAKVASPSPSVPPRGAPLPTPAAKSEPTRTVPSTPPTLVAARLCQTLSTGGDWNCVPPVEPVSPGALFFYSRVKSLTDTRVQHRWYNGNRLRKSVTLSIGANTSVGYRTYSRQTVDSRGGADWRVELRSMDGTLLQEERFVVQ